DRDGRPEARHGATRSRCGRALSRESGGRTMKWLKALVLCGAILLLTGLAVSLWADLPSLERRPVSRALTDTADTRLGRAVATQTAERPGLTGVYPLNDGPDAFAAHAPGARGRAQHRCP